MRVGFTGSRAGMSGPQERTFDRFIAELPSFDEFHHGCCLGADAEAVDSLYDMREYSDMDTRGWEIIGHPSDRIRFTDDEAKRLSDHLLPARTPLDRNRDIVDACDILLACPHGPEEQRSGTWATVRYARKQGKRIVIFHPDGSVTEEPARTPKE